MWLSVKSSVGSTPKWAHDGRNESSNEDDGDELPKVKQKVNAGILLIDAIFRDCFAQPF
jgi:hypothetical protein